jgi:flagellar biosynthetic protein FlhB
LADKDRTEKATPRRERKAREKGQVPRSRELGGTLSLLSAIVALSWVAPRWVPQWRSLWRDNLSLALTADITPDTALFRTAGTTVLYWIAPVLCTAWLVAIGAMFAQGGFVFAPVALSAKWSRLNPVANLGQLFSTRGLSRVAKSLVPLSIIAYLGVAIIMRDWGTLIRLSEMGYAQFPGWLFRRLFEIGWKSCGVLLVWAALDYVLQRFNFAKSLRMTKQEVKDEHKEGEGNPQTKRRIRMLQRQMRRRRLLQAVKEATVVVTNPTHYAVALRYDLDTMAAPVVVAKGADLIALEIRRIAQWNGVPIIENKPLAQLLYRSVEEGQFIPAKLYVAVAEILALVYKMQSRNRHPGGTGPGTGGGAH